MGDLLEFPGTTTNAVADLLEETAAKLRSGELAMGQASQCVILLAGQTTDVGFTNMTSTAQWAEMLNVLQDTAVAARWDRPDLHQFVAERAERRAAQ